MLPKKWALETGSEEVADERMVFFVDVVSLSCDYLENCVGAEGVWVGSGVGKGGGFVYATEGEGWGEGESLSLFSGGEGEGRIEVMYFLVRPSMVVNRLLRASETPK